ncbi:MAG: chemotaxis protein CheW [Desulfobacterales bacterium]
MKIFVFKVKDDFLGIESQYIHRIIDDSKITPVCLTPECYEGLLYYRGELFDVINLTSFLGYPKKENIEIQRIIIIKWGNKKMAIIPDDIIGMIWMEDDSENQTACYYGNKVVRLLNPDNVWKKLTGLSYGSRKI